MKSSLTCCLIILLLAGCSSKTWCGLAMCTDQTGMQMEYTDARDQCRTLATLRVNMNAQDEESEAPQKNKLVAAFSDCMKQKGWEVPGGDADKTPAKNEPWPHGTEPLAPVTAKETQQRSARAAECSFARQEASFSLPARERAEACDLECANQQRVAPESPRSPACP